MEDTVTERKPDYWLARRVGEGRYIEEVDNVMIRWTWYADRAETFETPAVLSGLVEGFDSDVEAVPVYVGKPPEPEGLRDEGYRLALMHIRKMLGLPDSGFIADDIEQYVEAKVEEARRKDDEEQAALAREIRELLSAFLDASALRGHALSRQQWERACLLCGRWCYPFADPQLTVIEEARNGLPPGYERTEVWAAPDKSGDVDSLSGMHFHDDKADAEESARTARSNGTIRQVILGPVETVEPASPEDDEVTREAMEWLEDDWRPVADLIGCQRGRGFVQRPRPDGKKGMELVTASIHAAMSKLLDEGWKA